jgi:alkanesulfonate monooxygenase SsuD/methylene tetrahydromethanopterin reductase-like flavin-dependent oxidoreductase (luciferase family)
VEQLSFGLSLPNRAVLFGVPIDTLFQITQAAEDSHLFRSVWVGDNFLSKPRLEAIVLLSALAARTTRLHVGTVCLATFPMRHPVQLAIQWASLDLIAGGRSILAVCLGQSANDDPKFAAEYQAMGIRNAERVGRLEEGIDLLRRFWAGGAVTHSGRFYQFEGVDPLPKPLQSSLPIVIAANPWGARDDATKERIMRRVAKLGDGWQTDGIPAREFASTWERIRTYADELGRGDKVNHASLHLMVNVNADARRARRDAVEFLDHYYGVGAVNEEKIAAWLAAGPPHAVAEMIDSYVQAGCTTVIIRFASTNQMDQLNQFIEWVLPAFAGRVSTA